MVNTQTPTHDQIMTGGPPLSAPMMSTPERAVQLETIEKQNPIMLTRLNVRLSSVMLLEAAKSIMHPVMLTLLVAQLLESDIICCCFVKDLWFHHVGHFRRSRLMSNIERRGELKLSKLDQTIYLTMHPCRLAAISSSR